MWWYGMVWHGRGDSGDSGDSALAGKKGDRIEGVVREAPTPTRSTPTPTSMVSSMKAYSSMRTRISCSSARKRCIRGSYRLLEISTIFFWETGLGVG